MKKISPKLLATAASLAALLSFQGTALAQTAPGWYMGASVGQTEIKPDFTGSPTASQDKSSTGYKLIAGYQLDPTWAIEGQYHNLGKYQYNDPGLEKLDLKDQGISMAVTGLYPLASGFSVLGKAGIVVHRLKADYAGFGMTQSVTKTESSLLLGVGVEYSMTPQLALRAEYEYFGTPKAEDLKIRTSLVSVGLRYKF